MCAVTRGHFWSRDKDGDYTTRSAICRKPYAAPYGSVFHRTGVIAGRSFTLQDYGSTFLAPVTLTLIR